MDNPPHVPHLRNISIKPLPETNSTPRDTKSGIPLLSVAMKDFWSFQLGIQKDDDHPSCIDPTYCLGWLDCFVEMDGEHFWGKGGETNEWQMWRKMI